MIGYLKQLLFARKLVVTFAVAGAFFASVFTLAKNRTFTVRAAIAPESASGNLDSYARLASQFGVSLPTGGQSSGPELYVYLLRSDGFLQNVGRQFVASSPSNARAFFEEVGMEPSDTARWVAFLPREIRRRMSTRLDLRAGVVELRVVTADGDLGVDFTTFLLDALERFDRSVRQSRAENERAFVEERLAIAKSELQSAETALMAFLAENRGSRSSPDLTLREGRLSRAVQEAGQLVSALRQSYEEAKLAEVRNTPVFSVLEAPEVPLLPDRRFLIRFALLGGVGGAVLGFGIFLLLIALGRALTTPDGMVVAAMVRSSAWTRWLDRMLAFASSLASANDRTAS